MTKLIEASRRVRDRVTLTYFSVKNFLEKKEEGASLVEYALLVALIAVALIATLKLLKGGIVNTFTNAINNL